MKQIVIFIFANLCLITVVSSTALAHGVGFCSMTQKVQVGYEKKETENEYWMVIAARDQNGIAAKKMVRDTIKEKKIVGRAHCTISPKEYNATGGYYVVAKATRSVYVWETASKPSNKLYNLVRYQIGFGATPLDAKSDAIARMKQRMTTFWYPTKKNVSYEFFDKGSFTNQSQTPRLHTLK